MAYYPIFLDLRGKKVLVVGGGSVAERKIDTLLDFGGTVCVVARRLTPVLAGYVDEGKIRFEGEEFKESHLNDAFLVIAATDDPLLNRRVSRFSRERGILVNAVDQPGDCTFIVPSTLRRGDLVVAVSTSGKSPALARRLRERLEETFGKEYETLLDVLGKIREEVLSKGLSQEENGRILRRLVDSDLLPAIRQKDWEHAASILRAVTGREWSGADLLKIPRGT
ncbi:MAG: bifunctional precorrin-2 dehydrogenase/sirohydrochlorin ferrochelatase [Thermodesulfobacteriota bacterium]